MVLLQQELWLRCAKLTLSLSLRFNGHFPRVPVLACVCWSTTRWWWQLELQYWNRSCQNLISCIINTLSLSLAAIFPGEPGLAGFVEAKDDGGAGDNWSYTSCKAPVKSSLPTNQHPVFFTGRMAFLSPNQQCQSTEWKKSHSMDLLTPSSPGGLPTLSLTTNSSWLSWGRVVMPLISPLMPVPQTCKAPVTRNLTPSFFTGWFPFLLPNRVRGLKRKSITWHGLAHP